MKKSFIDSMTCTLCGEDLNGRHKLSFEHVRFRMHTVKKQNIPVTHLVMSEAGYNHLKDEYIRRREEDGLDDCKQCDATFHSAFTKADKLFGCTLCFSERIPEYEVIPIWSTCGDPVVHTEDLPDGYYIDWSRLPKGTYLRYKDMLCLFDGFKMDMHDYYSGNKRGIHLRSIDHFDKFGGSSFFNEIDPRKVQFIFKQDAEKYTIRLYNGDECVRPCLLLAEFDDYWGNVVQNNTTKEWVKVDRLSREGEYSMRWWYDNFTIDGYRPVGVGIYGAISHN